MQNLLVGLIVLACTFYAVWALLPLSWRRSLAARLAMAPWPAPIKRRLEQAAQAGNACGCNGCDRGKAPDAKPIRFHPRRH
ncbi:MAG: hypothetical protein H7Z15_15790 [Rhizobacter sp.]|nr:hypothetical protein [Rhizobacter sp.]